MKRIAKVIVLIMVMAAAVFAADIHIIYNNGHWEDSPNDNVFTFDVKAYVTGAATDIQLKEFLIYVQYPTSIFGDDALIEGVATIEKAGICAGTFDPPFDVLGDKYNVTNSNQTENSTFGFEVQATQTGMPSFYSNLGTSEATASHLLTISLENADNVEGSGKVFYPNWPNDLDIQFKDFSDVAYALDFGYNDVTNETTPPVTAASESNAIASFLFELPTPIEIAESSLEYNSGRVQVKWTTGSETENLGFVLKRTENRDGDNGVYVVVGSYKEDRALKGAGTSSEENSYEFVDYSVSPGKTYNYVIEDVDYAGNIEKHDLGEVIIPENKLLVGDDFELSASYPNPFNPAFVVPFNLYRSKSVSIKMYDVAGKLVKVVADGYMEAGDYNLVVNGSELSSGVYFLKTSIGEQYNTQKMLLVK